jgi:hypothetical protein
MKSIEERSKPGLDSSISGTLLKLCEGGGCWWAYVLVRAAPNTALHLTAYSLRSFLTSASGGR